MINMTMLGNIGGDAVLKHFDGKERSVVNFSIAHTENRTNASGTKESHTVWVDASWWLKKEIAIKVAPYLLKGKKVYITGQPGARAYIPNAGGDPRATLTINVDKMEFAEAASKDGATNNSTAAATQNNKAPEYAPPADISSAPEEDDLPF